ncbi:hypothetical protein Asphe3_29880 [Pseudarthrobacter phenanthrenivorans Sphe3]|uniref:Mucin n=1 Tax=Pseudarthrobacter phenanthrenivorans (strain DSM 18606 / JCM 16027 / LMG 23796 / Sphe3) TaxID=930171 RepID=F0MBV8_PSEPM|nr:hypothetical protein [Pseudarthrobacter phenanthrenivorans]ADX74099.1 hypothetical protein Asphe3_29880 [Pseudarthrobacter phenanthrenivorans Sphe3]
MNRKNLAARMGALGLGLVLFTACSGAPALDPGTAAELQQRVSATKQLTAQQDFAAALAELDRLGQDVAAAAGKGLMSPERRASAEAAISKIRAELEAARAAAEPQPAPSPEPTADEDRQEQDEDARKDAEKKLEEAQKEAEKEAEKAKEKGKGNG